VRCFVVAGFLLTSASCGPSAIAEFLVKIKDGGDGHLENRKMIISLL